MIRFRAITIFAALSCAVTACGASPRTPDSAQARRDSVPPAPAAAAPTPPVEARKDSVVGRDSVIRPRMGLDKKGRKVPIDTLRTVKPN
jgi:hypothetical protein